MSEQDRKRYRNALHAVQSGVAFKMQKDLESRNSNPSTSTKQLRTGIESAFVSDAAIARLLIQKGLFTQDEYEHALASEAEAEKARYEHELGVSLA